MLAPRTTHKPPPEVFQPGPEGDAARKQYGDWYTELMSHEWFMNGYHLGYRYDDSPIVVPDGTPAPPLEGQTYTQTARPGARAPHVWLGDGRSTLDLFGRGFVLLRIGPDAPAGERHRARLRRAWRSADVEARSPRPRFCTAYERAWCWCGPTAMSPGAATTEPEDCAAPWSIACAARGRCRQAHGP